MASAIANQFVTSYYQMFDTNRAGLVNFYNQGSVLTFEGNVMQGPEAIVKKLVELPFQVIQHAVTTIDHQMSVDGGLIIFVLGQLKTDNDPPHSFSQVFYLKQVGDSLFIVNDMFRLAIHNG